LMMRHGSGKMLQIQAGELSLPVLLYTLVDRMFGSQPSSYLVAAGLQGLK